MNFKYLKIIGIGFLFLSCEKEPVVAVVNAQPIYLKEVVLKLKEARIKAETHRILQNIFYEKLQELINRELLITSFTDVANSISEKEVEKEMFKNYSRDEAKKFLKEEGIPYNEWFYTHRRDTLAFLIFEKIFEREKGEAIPEVKKGGDEDLSPYVEILHIVANTKENIEKAQELIKKGTPFEEVAKEYSVSPEGKRGGKLDPFFPGEMPPEFDVCFTMREGEVSPIIKSAYGYHLFKVLKKGKISKNERTIKEVKEIKDLERKEQFFTDLITELQKKAEIKRNSIPFENIKW